MEAEGRTAAAGRPVTRWRPGGWLYGRHIMEQQKWAKATKHATGLRLLSPEVHGEPFMNRRIFVYALVTFIFFTFELNRWHENRSFVTKVKVYDDKLKIKRICMGFYIVAKQHRKKSKQASDSVREQKWEAAAEKRGWEEAGMKEILPFSWWWCASFCETLYFGWLGTKKQSKKDPVFVVYHLRSSIV